MAREMACRKCKRVTTEKVCPACKSSDLTPDWNGVVLVVDPTNSEISKTLAITQKGSSQYSQRKIREYDQCRIRLHHYDFRRQS